MLQVDAVRTTARRNGYLQDKGMAIECHETPRLEGVLSDGGELSSSLTGLGRTSDIIIQIRCWVDHRGGFDAVKGGLVRAGKLNTDSAAVQPLS